MLTKASNALRDAVRDVPDFPKPGIIFRDITPELCRYRAAAFQEKIDRGAEQLPIAKDRRDVFEDDPGLREIGHVAYGVAQGVAGFGEHARMLPARY